MKPTYAGANAGALCTSVQLRPVRRGTQRVATDHVLIVDDEEGIRLVLNAEAGLEAMTSDPAPVVFCDVQMPGQGDLWLAGMLRAQFPHAAIILATGSVTTVPATTTLRPGIIAYLTKPFSAPDVRTALQGAEKRIG